jgi:hypothetical protein
MPDSLSTTTCPPLIGGFGRRGGRAPSGESQSSMVPVLFTNSSIERTNSDRPHSPIYILNDDVLVNVFYLYQLHVQDEYADKDGLRMLDWERQRWWYKLAQVSRRWRYIILASRSVLDLHLLCTYGVPVADMLAHSPSLPLTIYYNNGDRTMTIEDEQGVLLALSHRDRLHRIALRMPAPNLDKFISTMDEPFPILERMYIYSLTEEETGLTLPQTFQAPNLRRIHLWYSALPIRSPLLTSTVGLVYLSLGGIPRSAYFPPSYLLTRLALMPQLEKLGIGFHSPIQNHDVVRQLLDTPILTHITLPNLRVFSFRGVSAYLEGLLARISTPILSVLVVLFFNQLTFTVPWLFQTIQTSQNLRFNAVRLAFCSDFADLIVDPHSRQWDRPLHLRIMCRPFDWQVASAMQILATLSPVLSVVEVLTLSHEENSRSSETHNEIDRTQWRELLRSFSNVKVLHLENEIVEALSHSLRSDDGEMTLELLPNLEELSYSGGHDVSGAFTSFINERQAAGHTVRLDSRL